MPLLRKKVFEKQEVPDYLRDDEEVFYCELTNEVFRDYHDFSERMFLCNSMVWTCSLTGKSNLTYQEALDSEKHALRCLKVFPDQLKLPILYLGTLTKRTFFGEMADDIFVYTKDRYFVGENVEACFTANKWKDCHIISVMVPDLEKYKHEINANGSKSPSERHFIPSSELYKYQIEHLDVDDNDISEVMIVDSTQIRRKKLHFSKDKCKLFLKQNVEQDSRGIFIIKADALEKYGVKNIQWESLFGGPLPNFQPSKNFEKAANGKKRQRQETMSKYLQRNGLVMKKDNPDKTNNNLLEQMRLREEEFKKQKQLRDEQKALEKQQNELEKRQFADYYKEWLKPKEDLELEDHVKLPVPTPVKCKVSDRYIGDMFAILEFVHNFPKFLPTKDFFPDGLNLELMEKALTDKSVAGPLTDFIQMLLVAIFNCQEEESNGYNTGVEKIKDINEKTDITAPSTEDGIHLASLASQWSTVYQGLPINRLPLYSLTVSEILRLHFLSSGAKINDTGAKWRYSQRGGYSNEDDPGLYLRLHHSYILKALAVHNVVQLPIADKIKIILTLMNQILTYADPRDVAEEKVEKIKVAKTELRNLKMANKKREVVFNAQRVKLKKELGKESAALQQAMDQLQAENEKNKEEIEEKIKKLRKVLTKCQVLLGRDRAFRKYLKLDSVCGIFVNWEDEMAGSCLDKLVRQNPELANLTENELKSHVKMLWKNNTNKPNSPTKRKTSTEKNNGMNGISNDDDIELCKELLLCTADPRTCHVHNEKFTKPRWGFFHQEEQLRQLIKSLNARGVRESELKETLLTEEAGLLDLISRTPVSVLNSDMDVKKEEEKKKKKNRYDDANLGYPLEMDSEAVLENVLVENILEMEGNIFAGCLGTLKVKDRDNWRNCLQNKNYEEFEQLSETAVNGIKHEHESERSRSSSPDLTEKKKEKVYQDPGRFLGDPDFESTDSEADDSDNYLLLPTERTRKAIKSLAQALVHVAEAVQPKYLKKPLGHVNNKSTKEKKSGVINNWKTSLAASTSYSQVLLHYGTLDSCIMWTRSALLARCQMCKRHKDSENMLLCDNCNLGYHMYCLKPGLTVVPKGDWFCKKCKDQNEEKDKVLHPEPAKRRRRIFVEAEMDDEPDSGNDEGGEEESSGKGELSSGEDDEASDSKIDLCKTCGSGGEIVQCERCHFNFHKECVHPPLRRLPRGAWTCPSCLNKSKPGTRTRERARENSYDSDYGSRKLKGVSYSQRKCAAMANRKIYAFHKALRDIDKWLEDTDNDEDSDEEVLSKRFLRREENRDDLPLHNAVLQELLSDVMKFEAAWPFLRPVQQKEVPDYYKIITNPMDFGTIKYKLNMGEYSTDAQLLKDVSLVFDNCNIYNSCTDEVYLCGQRLLQHFCKRAKELGLELPSELVAQTTELDCSEPMSKKQRTQ